MSIELRSLRNVRVIVTTYVFWYTKYKCKTYLMREKELPTLLSSILFVLSLFLAMRVNSLDCKGPPLST